MIPPRAVRERRESTQCRCCHAQHVAGAVFGARGDDDAGVPVPERHMARGAFGMCQCLDSTGTERDRYGSTGHADQSIIHTRDQFEKCRLTTSTGPKNTRTREISDTGALRQSRVHTNDSSFGRMRTWDRGGKS